MSNSGCSEPFITEEILIIAQSLAKERIQYYKEEKSDEKHLSLFLPEFEALENKEENQFMERSVFNFGSPHYYNYTEQEGDEDELYSYRELYKKEFKIKAAHDNPITYDLEMSIQVNFLLGAGFKAFLVRKDFGIKNCLLKNTCV